MGAQTDPPVNRSEFGIVILLRLVGLTGLFAIPAVFLPYAWMNACHEYLGLGVLPDTPITSYLTRSLSAFYAFVSAIMLFVSFDVRRYRPIVALMGILVTTLGGLLTWIDVVSGMPASWTWCEGPPAVVVGLLLLWWQRGVREPATADATES